MLVKRVDHIGVIVANLNEAKEFVTRTLGLAPGRALDRPDLQAQFLDCGDVAVELIELRDAEARKSRLGDGHEARIDHIAFEVENLEQTIALLEGLGMRFTAAPRKAGDFISVFTSPDSSKGVMYQFMQRA